MLLLQAKGLITINIIDKMRKVLCVAALVLVVLQVWSAGVDQMTAQSRALRFLQQQSTTGRLRSSVGTTVILAYAEAGVDKMPVFYVFNSGQSFVSECRQAAPFRISNRQPSQIRLKSHRRPAPLHSGHKFPGLP